MKPIRNVLVTGGGGYVGSVLTPRLAAAGYRVKVVDLFLYGEEVLASLHGNKNVVLVRGDIRDAELLGREMAGTDAVIHLACISNDPSYELDPELGKSINYDASLKLIDLARDAGVRRFVYASSSSVYGVKEESEVTEDLELTPLTSYSKYKALCEEYLLKKQTADFTTLVLRPATVCGYAPRLRLDLTVNILTACAIRQKLIKVFGGEQTRPNIHIEDMADLYVKTLEYPDKQIAGKVFNAGYENTRVDDLARTVRSVLGEEKIRIETLPSDDKRSYRISSEKIRRELGFEPRRTVEDAVRGLKAAFDDGRITDPEDKRYYNIRLMRSVRLQ